MTREEHLRFCRVCKNQQFDLDQGLVCRLTGKVADFQDHCPDHQEDDRLKSIAEAHVVDPVIHLDLAPREKRLANFILDLIFYMIFSYIFGFFLGIVLYAIDPYLLEALQEENRLLDYALGLIAGIIFYFGSEWLFQRTPAKYITGTRVTNASGERPDASSLFLRTLCRFIPFEAFSFLGKSERGWHDRFSGTYVVLK